MVTTNQYTLFIDSTLFDLLLTYSQITFRQLSMISHGTSTRYLRSLRAMHKLVLGKEQGFMVDISGYITPVWSKLSQFTPGLLPIFFSNEMWEKPGKPINQLLLSLDDWAEALLRLCLIYLPSFRRYLSRRMKMAMESSKTCCV